MLTKKEIAEMLTASPAWDGIKDPEELAAAYDIDELRDALAMLDEAEQEYFEHKYMAVSEYAQRHGVTPRAVRKKINNGTLPAIMSGGVWLIDSDTPYTDRRVKSEKYKNWRKK